MTNYSFIRHKYILPILLVFGCYITDSTATEELESQSKKNQENIGLLGEDLNNNSNEIILLQEKIAILELEVNSNSKFVKELKDSLKAFRQLNISVETSDQDIINSLIRIQSKLNIIEDKIFYSDSLYFNLLNDFVLIESQIENLDSNIKSIAKLNDSIVKAGTQDENTQINDEVELENVSNRNEITDYKSSYDLAVGLYKEKEYEKSMSIFKSLVVFDNKNNLADNCQFWIGQIYYVQGEFDTAIIEYGKVSIIGDGNKAADAAYKIALSYLNLGSTNLAIEQFNNIIKNYPNNTDLVNKSKMYIERNN